MLSRLAGALETLLRVVVGVAAVVGLPAFLYDTYVPGHMDEVVGSVVTREVFVDQGPPRDVVHVRLADGTTVRAHADRFVTVLPGEQIVLARIVTPLFGRYRYRYK